MKDLKQERKTKKLSVACKPSAYIQAKKIAIVQDVTINAVFNHALTEYLKSHKADVDKFDQMNGVITDD